MWHFCTQCCFVIRPLYFLQIMTEAHVQVKLKLDSLCLCRMSDLTFFKQTPEAHLIREVWVLSLHQFRDISTPLRRSRSTCLFAVDAQDAKVAASSPLAPAEVIDPKPAQPTPVIQVDAAHKQLKSYLPGELCEAFRAAGMTHDLYDWQVCLYP